MGASGDQSLAYLRTHGAFGSSAAELSIPLPIGPWDSQYIETNHGCPKKL